MPPSPAALIEYPAADVPQYAVADAGPIVISSNEQYSAIAERLKTIMAFKRQVQDFFAPHKKRANDAHKALCDDERKALQPADADERRLKTALVAYTTEQDRIRRIEEQRLRDEQRQRDETQRLNEAAALETEANQTGDLALKEQAEQLIDQPIAVMPVQASTPAPPKVEGLSYRETFRGEITDFGTLVKAAAADPQWLALLEPNQTAIDGMARALKQRLAIPGVRLVVDKVPVTRR